MDLDAGGTQRAEFLARKMPQGWLLAGFDMTDVTLPGEWRRADVIRGRVSNYLPMVSPWTRLLPRDIPHMTADPVATVAIAYTEECLDIMNRVRSEDLSTSLSAPGQPLNYARVDNAASLCASEDAQTAEVVMQCSTQHLGKVFDGVYNPCIILLRLRSCTAPIIIKSLQAIVMTYPYAEKGEFIAGDALLEQIFDISCYTLRLCSNEFIMDTPWREQAQWLGDVAAVTLGGIYTCFGDTDLPGKFLRQAAANQHPTGMISNVSNSVNHRWQSAIPDYSLWGGHSLWNHYMYTGETRWIHNYYATALHIFQAHLHYVNAYGLIENMPYWPFVDWADVDKRGECAAYNAIFYGMLEALLQMAALKHDVVTFARVEQLMSLVAENFQPRLYDPSRHCFADARVDDVLSPKVSEHANLAAIYWDLCDKATAADIIQRFYEDKSLPYTEAQPFFTTIVLQALDRAGRFDLALDMIRERWGERMVARGATSTFEEWGQNGSWRSGEYSGFFRTHSHAWAAHPADFLIRNMMGLEILEPGCARIYLHSKVTSFDYDITFPTPRGPICVQSLGADINITVPESVQILI